MVLVNPSSGGFLFTIGCNWSGTLSRAGNISRGIQNYIEIQFRKTLDFGVCLLIQMNCSFPLQRVNSQQTIPLRWKGDGVCIIINDCISLNFFFNCSSLPIVSSFFGI